MIVACGRWPPSTVLKRVYVAGSIRCNLCCRHHCRTCQLEFFFALSVSAVANWSGLGLVPEPLADDPAIAQEMG